MDKFYKVESIVRKILENEPQARKDDMMLFYLYCTKYGILNEKAFVKLFKDKVFRKKYNISVFETVSRARRKIQAENESLRPDEKVQKIREEQEGKYFNYAINGYKPTFKKLLENHD